MLKKLLVYFYIKTYNCKNIVKKKSPIASQRSKSVKFNIVTMLNLTDLLFITVIIIINYYYLLIILIN